MNGKRHNMSFLYGLFEDPAAVIVCAERTLRFSKPHMFTLYLERISK